MLPADEVLSCQQTAGAGHVIGTSRQGTEIRGCVFGRGPLRVSLIAGCHADEPVGPLLLSRLAAYLSKLSPDDPALTACTWRILPHINPDGRASNRAWQDTSAESYDLDLYIDHVVREQPGDDVEFGFPRDEADTAARPENQAAAAFLREGGPYDLHVSFHGMAVGAGPWFLIEPAWAERSAPLQRALGRAASEMGYTLHDEDRRGEKGFHRIARGFATRPDSEAMRDYFLQRDDPETAGRFRPSSMEMIRALGGDPLTLVSEMPLFIWSATDQDAREQDQLLQPGPGQPAGELLRKVRQDASLRRHLTEHGLRPVPIRDQMLLQIALLNAGLDLVGGD